MKNKTILPLLAILAIFLAAFVFLLSSKYLVPNDNFSKEVSEIETTSDSDEIEAIEEDITNTDTDSLLDDVDSEMDSIEKELDAALNEI